MKDFLNKYYQNHALVYKVLLFIVITVTIVYLFPKGGQFPYDIQKGKPWQYPNLYAPFDFAILKTDEDISKEKEEIEANKKLYFTIREDVYKKVEDKYLEKILLVQEDSAAAGLGKNRIKAFGLKFLKSVYKTGFLNKSDNEKVLKNSIITLRSGNEAEDILSDNLFTTEMLVPAIQKYLDKTRYQKLEQNFTTLFFDILEPNIFYDDEFTQKVIDEETRGITVNKGLVTENERIISK